jgi:hypothetical protein
MRFAREAATKVLMAGWSLSKAIRARLRQSEDGTNERCLQRPDLGGLPNLMLVTNPTSFAF